MKNMKRALSLENVNSADNDSVSQQAKKGKKSSALSCYKCNNTCKVSDPKCDYCFQACHFSCFGLSVKGAKLDAVQDLLSVIGFTCGSCKTLIRNLLHSVSVQTSTKQHEDKIEKLSKEVNEIKNQSKLLESLGTETGVQSANGSRATSEGSAVWSEVKKTISKQVKDVYKRSRNVVVSGIQESSDNVVYNSASDISSFKNLCNKELAFNPTVIMTRRLGHPGSAPRRLLVSVSSEQDVACILRECKRLRKSSDHHVAKNIFINPDLSPDDAKKAFEVRKARREAKSGSSNDQAPSRRNNYRSGTSTLSVSQHSTSLTHAVSSLSHQDYPPLPASSQPLQISALNHSKPLSPSAVPFVVSSLENVSASCGSATAATLPTCSSSIGVDNSSPGCSSAASTAKSN